MTYRAPPIDVPLTEYDVAQAKGMLQRGDRQDDIAAWFGVSAGRIAEIATGRSFYWVPAVEMELPPPGPYPCGRDAVLALNALTAAETAIEAAKKVASEYRSE